MGRKALHLALLIALQTGLISAFVPPSPVLAETIPDPIIASNTIWSKANSETGGSESHSANSQTVVGGIISTNTTWTKNNSPYQITNTVQIPAGVTLTIEPGASVTMSGGSGYMFLVHGTVFAHGTSTEKIVLDGGGHPFFSYEASDDNALVDLDYCIIRNGGNLISFVKRFYLRHSEITNIIEHSDMSTGPTNDVYIEYNRFTNVAGFQCGRGSTVYFRYNIFDTKNHALKPDNFPWIWNLAGPKTVVKYNSFINSEGIVLRLYHVVGTEGIIATENYWGTQDTNVIDGMIYDKNDDIRLSSYIDYLPILTTPPGSPENLDHVLISPDKAFVPLNSTCQFTASAYDQLNNSIPGLSYTWSVVAGGGSINAGGLFTAGGTSGTFSGTVQAQASYGGSTKQGTTSVAVGASITVMATLQGDSRTDAGMNVPLTLKLYNQAVDTNNILILEPAATSASSAGGLAITNRNTTTKVITFTAGGLPTGPFNVTLHTPQSLVNLKNGVTIAQGTNIDMGTLLEGDAADITEDSKTIDIADFTRFATAYESVPSSPNWDERADFNRNGQVEVTDFAALYTNYGKTSPQVIQ